MSESLWRDRVIRVVWPLLESRLGQLQRQLAFVRRDPGGGCLPCAACAGGSGPSPGQAQVMTLTARGAVSQGDPLMGLADFPGHAAVLTPDELGVTNYLGWAANSAADGGAVGVAFAGPCSLFQGLNTNPSAPDTLEVYVYGPGPPVPASQLPAAAFFRRCGAVISSTTVLLGKGDKAYNP